MKMAIAQFTSASTAGVVNVQLGFKPDFCIFIADLAGTNPNINIWGNAETVPSWTAALALLITGSTGVVTRDTASLNTYDGGDVIASAETVNSAPKHVDLYGTAAAAGAVTSEGISIPADHQGNSKVCMLFAFGADYVPAQQA